MSERTDAEIVRAGLVPPHPEHSRELVDAPGGTPWGGCRRCEAFAALDRLLLRDAEMREKAENLAGDVYLYSLQGDGPEGREIAWEQVLRSQTALLAALNPSQTTTQEGEE